MQDLDAGAEDLAAADRFGAKLPVRAPFGPQNATVQHRSVIHTGGQPMLSALDLEGQTIYARPIHLSFEEAQSSAQKAYRHRRRAAEARGDG
jgi:hypothetical protein